MFRWSFLNIVENKSEGLRIRLERLYTPNKKYIMRVPETRECLAPDARAREARRKRSVKKI